MNSLLAFFICQILIIVSRAQNEQAIIDKITEILNKDDKVKVVELPNVMKPSFTTVKYIPEPNLIHVKNKPEPNLIQIKNIPEPNSIHFNNIPEPNSIHVNNIPEPNSIHVNNIPEPNSIHVNNIPEPSLTTVKNILKNDEDDDTNMTAALLPMVSNLTTSVVDIEHVLKNLFASNGTQSMTSASTSPNVKATNPEPYHDQSTTECQSRSSNTHGGLNCIAKGFTIGGLTTILLLLSLSMAMKIAQPINEVDLINVYPKDIIGQPMGLTTCAPPTTISSTTISSTTKRRPNTPKPTTPKARPARVIRQKYIPIRIIPARYKNGAKPRSFAMKSLDNSSPIRQTEESDEISQKYE